MNLNDNPQAILTAKVGSTVIVDGREFMVQTTGMVGAGIYLITTNSNPDAYNALIELAEANNEEWPAYSDYTQHLRNGAHAAVMLRREMIECLITGNYYIG